MKKKILLFTLSLISAYGICNNTYRINENKVDELFNASRDISNEITTLYYGEHLNNFTPKE